MAAQIQAAKFVELPCDDHIAWIGDTEPLMAEVQEFLTGERPALEADRVLATVQSTQRATAIRDSRWRDLVDNYQQQVGKEVARLGGRVDRSRVVREHAGHRRQVADVSVQDPEKPDDGGLVRGDRTEVMPMSA
jgi:hypothetical protein